MKFVLLLILIIGLMILIPSYQGRQIERKLHSLNNIIRHITSTLNINVSYRLQVSDTTTYVKNKHEIYLVIWNNTTGTLYDDNTLIHALIHEIVHIIDNNPCLSHSDYFNHMEDRILQQAEVLGYYNPKIIPAVDYPFHT